MQAAGQLSVLSLLAMIVLVPARNCAQEVPAQQVYAQQVYAQQGPLLDINAAAVSQLLALPGMGPVYARRIVAGRPYTAKNQLLTRGVLPADVYAGIKDRIVAHRLKQPTTTR
jgi:DNA uptake protein ComE-like DNA-binding protein